MGEFSSPPPFSKPSLTEPSITFWTVNIVEDISGNDCIIFRNQCTHGKLSLFLIKTSNNSNATRHQKLFTISTRN